MAKRSPLPTPTELAVLNAAKKLKQKTPAMSPSVTEIADYLDRSIGSVGQSLKSLEVKGYVKRTPGKYRSLEICA